MNQVFQGSPTGYFAVQCYLKDLQPNVALLEEEALPRVTKTRSSQMGLRHEMSVREISKNEILAN